LQHAGVKRLRHPVVGMIEVAYDKMDLPAQPGLVLTFYTVEPGSPSEDALRVLASWAATIPGTYLVISAGTSTGTDPELVRRLQAAVGDSAPVTGRTAGEIAAWYDGLALAWPGVVDVQAPA
jgi:hypothetical protein